MKFLDCFAGIGGFRLGMEQAGHQCVGHIEIDKFANTTYNAIHRPKVITREEFETKEEYKKFDAIFVYQRKGFAV